MTLLSVADLRLHVDTDLDSAALQLLLDASEQALISRYGLLGAITQVFLGGGSYFFLRWPAASITSIDETDGETTTTLAADDYRLNADGVSVLRLDTGTNPRTGWGSPVTAVSYAVAGEAERKRVQLALIKLELNTQHGLSQQTIGSWSESYEHTARNYAEQREVILGSLLDQIAPGFA